MNNMQSSSGNFSMCQQVPMMFLLLLVYLSAAACISEEINLGPCWRRDVLIFKDERSSTKHKMLLCVSWRNQYAIISGYFLIRQQEPVVFKVLLVQW